MKKYKVSTLETPGEVGKYQGLDLVNDSEVKGLKMSGKREKEKFSPYHWTYMYNTSNCFQSLFKLSVEVSY